MANENPTSEFSYWRGLLWPVHGHELPKVLTMFLMFCFITFNYTLLRNQKDALVVSAAGAEIISFLKLYCTLPSAVIFMSIYSKASNMVSKPALFRGAMAPFILYFTLFGAVLFPNHKALQMDGVADFLAKFLPTAFADCFRFWHFSLFYGLAELWGTVVLSVLFWGLANDITPVSEAKRIYNLLGIGANFSVIFAGPFINILTALGDEDAFKYLCAFVVVAAFLILGLHWFLWNKVVQPANQSNLSEPLQSGAAKPKKKKVQMGFVEGVQALLKDKYILCIAALVMCYGVSINLVEVTWKNQIHHQYPDKADYLWFMGWYSSAVGASTVFMMAFVGGNMVRMMGWGFTAQFTPWMLGITGVVFFALVMVKNQVNGGPEYVFAAVMVGAVQNVASKASKYSLFDPTKEMSYIPLEDDRKVKGKAAVDGVASRLGKSGGSIIYQILLVLGGSLDNVTLPTGILLAIFIVAWIAADVALEKQFEVLNGNKDFKGGKFFCGLC